jgi:hypothetical protein
MNLEDEEKFRKAFNVRRCEKCCGNCKHFERDYEYAGCDHPKQVEFDSFVNAMWECDPKYFHYYGAYGGTDVDEGNVCDLWELKTGETK